MNKNFRDQQRQESIQLFLGGFSIALPYYYSTLLPSSFSSCVGSEEGRWWVRKGGSKKKSLLIISVKERRLLIFNAISFFFFFFFFFFLILFLQFLHLCAKFIQISGLYLFTPPSFFPLLENICSNLFFFFSFRPFLEISSGLSAPN